MNYQPRSAWGAAAPTWNPGRVSPALGLFIHYNGPAVSPAVLAGDYDAVAAFLRSIQRYHMQTNGWPDLAYSWIVDSVGRVWEGRGWDVAGAHTMDWNWKSHGLMLPLGADQKPTDAQIAGCRTVIAEANKRYGPQFVKGHREAPNSTSCPGEPTMALIRANAFSPGVNTPPTNPAPSPAPRPPAPPAGVDPTVNKPFLCRMGGPEVFLCWDNTPWRMHLRSQADVNLCKFFGIPDKGDIGRTFRNVTSVINAG